MSAPQSELTTSAAVALEAEALLCSLNPELEKLHGAETTNRRLRDLHGCFADESAYADALRSGNPIVYTLATVAPGRADGDLNYAVAIIQPGRIGPEYYMTKGHFHAWREASEIYIGLTGQGMMLLEAEASGESWTVPLRPHEVVYVPGHTAHRTINVGAIPLGYIGIYPAKAGHDYGAVARRNFGKMIIARDGQPVVVDRADFKNERH
jgi:glucose-6-phosphate isomerase